jgi:hypothetical protein
MVETMLADSGCAPERLCEQSCGESLVRRAWDRFKSEAVEMRVLEDGEDIEGEIADLEKHGDAHQRMSRGQTAGPRAYVASSSTQSRVATTGRQFSFGRRALTRHPDSDSESTRPPQGMPRKSERTCWASIDFIR